MPGHPETPIEDRVQLLRRKMVETVEFDVVQSLYGDLVLLDEYRDAMAENVAALRVPAITDAAELKKIIDAKATIIRLPKEIGARTNDIYEQIRERVVRARDKGMEVVTDFREVGERATDCMVRDEDETESELRTTAGRQ